MKIQFALAVLLCAFLAGHPVLADDVITTGNTFVQVEVLKSSGQFHIMKANGDPLSYSGGAGQWNSYTTFYLNATGSDVYYTNAIMKINNAGMKDMAGKTSIYYPPDSTWKVDDTIKTIWHNMRAFDVVQDLFPIMSDNGGEIVIRYGVTARTENTSNRFKGVLLMLDVAVNPASSSDQCSPDADHPIILSSTNYYARPFGNCWNGQEHRYTDTTGLPEWLLAGMRFPDYGGPGVALAKGTILGKGLYPPTELIVSDWSRMIQREWDFHDTIKSKDYSDAAIIYKWAMDIVGTSSPHLCSTAFGVNDDLQEYEICYNAPVDPMMIVTKISPTKHNRLPNGELDSLTTRVDAWVVNADHQNRSTQTDQLTIDLSNAPDFVTPSNLTQPPLLPVQGTTSSSLGPGNVGHTYWVLKLDSTKLATMQNDFVERIGFHLATPNIPSMKADCGNQIQTMYQGPPADVAAPVVARLTQTVKTKSTFIISDRKLGDRGLQSVDTTKVVNYRYGYAVPAGGCPDSDQFTIQVNNTTKNASFTFTVTDCAGNVSAPWTETYSPNSAVDEEPIGPSILTIQNYPNPFTSETDVEIVANGSGHLNAKLFSAVGAEVTRDANVQVNQTQSGWHLHISGNQLTPGLYTLAVGGATGIQRHTMLLMR